MSFTLESCEAFKRLSYPLVLAHITAKFILGLGIGIILSYYFKIEGIFGWIFIIIALILAAYPTLRIFEEKRNLNKKK